ncbi:hypothetical protein [Leucobacter manosquensis]|uniref:hypothetical protein n=1 Tax=Leucobacter manosquensis TaxID=2810611 RepID=UPI0020166936|nr:hypothetical protein [Leucobacter manosquensis]
MHDQIHVVEEDDQGAEPISVAKLGDLRNLNRVLPLMPDGSGKRVESEVRAEVKIGNGGCDGLIDVHGLLIVCSGASAVPVSGRLTP